MTFNSIGYFVFLALAVLLVWAVPSRWRNPLLLALSYYFYASWDWRFLALIVGSTLIGFTSGLAIHRAEDEHRRRQILISRVVANLAILGVFKYFNFFIDSGADLLDMFGADVGSPAVRILLPIGISFITFEEISYAIDVYRGELAPTKRLIDYALFVAFFPKLVAGPILRPQELLPQIEADRPPPGNRDVSEALSLIGLGLFKKVVIADSMARVADAAFDDIGGQSAIALLVGVYAFAFQIYGDFSGYSDIARGSSLLVGFSLPVNFRQPYLSNSVTAFWQTWHISLSSWLRDYLYVPLGGNRRGPRRTTINLFLVMAIGGLWHGAAWTFVVWGVVHGCILAVERRSGFGLRHNNADRPWRPSDLPATLLTFHLVCLAWIFFRAPSWGVAADYLTALVHSARLDFSGAQGTAMLLPAAAATVVVDLLQRRSGHEVPTSAGSARVGLLAGASAAAIVGFSGAAPVPFIYFQF
jgi:D-alanyl-lipoteichoic acid acyltransferase DltB (MBOAT superfamily)